MKTALLSFLPALASANVGINWYLNEKAPKDGYTDVNFPLDVSNSPRERNFYFAQQYSFQNASIGYTGLQPRADKNGAHFLHAVFSSFEGEAKSDDPNCSDGADGGSGISCAVDLYAPYDHLYVMNVHKQDGTNTWKGTVIDSVSGNSTHIGTYTLPSHAGNIKDSYLGFVEDYAVPKDKQKSCDLPATEVTFGKPFTKNKNEDGEVPSGTLSAPWAYNSCIDIVPFDYEKTNDGDYHVKYGGPKSSKRNHVEKTRHLKPKHYDS